MFDEKRRLTSTIYLGCLVLNLLVVFLPLPGFVKLVMLSLGMLVQLSASIWYSLSYIPYGRRTASRYISRTLGIEEGDYANIQLAG